MKKAAGNTKNRKKQAGDALVCFFYADLFFRLADRLIARLANSFDNLAERAVVGAHGFEALTGDFTGIADDDERIGVFLADDLADAEHLKATHGAEEHFAVLLQIAAAGLEKRQAAVHLLDDAVGNDIVFLGHNEEHFAVARICAVQNCIDDFCRYKNDDARVHGAFNALIYDGGKQHDAAVYGKHQLAHGKMAQAMIEQTRDHVRAAGRGTAHKDE